MQQNKQHELTIGIVLSSAPKYSETFFRSKIRGLQSNDYKVILFVDYFDIEDQSFPCKIIAAKDFNKSLIKSVKNSLAALLKSVFVHPRKSMKLYQLDKADGVAFKDRMKHLILNEFFLNEKVDWLHFGFGILAQNRENIAKTLNAKMAVSFRGYDLYLSPLKHKGCYDRLFLKDVNYHVLSYEMKQTLVDYKINQNRINVITPAIDISFFQTDTQKNNVNDYLKLVTVARLHWKKGLEYTLEALKILKDAGVKFQYTVVGEGTELERLLFATHQLNLKNEVVFAGKLSPEEVKDQLSNSDVYLQYSIQEGFCNAVLEAQAMGLLCVVSNAEGLSENVLNNETGWVVPKRKPKRLADKIIEIIDLPSEEKNKIRQYAISRIREEFYLEKQNQEFMNFYQNLE